MGLLLLETARLFEPFEQKSNRVDGIASHRWMYYFVLLSPIRRKLAWNSGFINSPNGGTLIGPNAVRLPSFVSICKLSISLFLCLYFDGNSFARLPSPPLAFRAVPSPADCERDLLWGHFVSANCGSSLTRSNQTKISINIPCDAHIDLWPRTPRHCSRRECARERLLFGWVPWLLALIAMGSSTCKRKNHKPHTVCAP